MRRVLPLAVVAIAALLVVPAAVAWTWPADGPVLRPFSLAEDEYAAGQHRGIDIGADAGTDVRSPVAGTVSFAGSIPGGGRALTIQTADGYAVTLLQLGSLEVARGGAVVEGAVRRDGRRERGRRDQCPACPSRRPSRGRAERLRRPDPPAPRASPCGRTGACGCDDPSTGSGA